MLSFENSRVYWSYKLISTFICYVLLVDERGIDSLTLGVTLLSVPTTNGGVAEPG